MAEGMNARVHNKPIHFVLWTKGDNIRTELLLKMNCESENNFSNTKTL
jgi:hypothetical protein